MELPSSQMPDALGAHTEKDWDDLRMRGLLYAYKYFSYIPYLTRGRMSVEDLVHEALSDMLEGQRRQPENVDSFTFLCGAIRSEFDNLYRKEKAATFSEESLPPDYSPFLPSVSLEETQSVFDYQQLCDKVRELVSDDAELVSIVEVWFEEPDMKPKDIACRLGLSMDDMHNAQKRLRRRAINLREKWFR
jgi:DNA-directed RNA polymerase specialized sigma24 family protein